MPPPPPRPTLFPYTTLFRSQPGKRSCGPKNIGCHDEGRDTAQGAVEGLRHQVIKVHPESAPDRCLPIRPRVPGEADADRKSTRLNSSHRTISYAVFCLKKKT